ncbi:MAG: right-handed parallel beta-helix repeat-containing protein [Armatimonadetes bacterium]|nr:right-handed parallel beta-helix repeat-containing protein [Armatimonadota bacterium]
MLGLIAIGLTASVAVYHVSPDGDDSASGSSNAPVATISQGVRLAGPGDIVVVHEGEYRITEPILIGKDKARLLLKARGRVVLRGGLEIPKSKIKSLDIDIERRLTKAASQNVLQVDLREIGIAAIDPLIARGMNHREAMAPVELFVGDEAQTLARWPNEGFVRTGKVTDKGAVPRFGDYSGKKAVFEFPQERIESWQTLEDVWAFGYWMWDWADESIPVESYRDGKLTLGGPHFYGVRENRPIYFENVLEELDSPGEYYIDRERMRLFFWPSTSGTAHLSLNKKPMLLIVEAEEVTVEGLRFVTSRQFTVDITGGRDVVLRNCVFRNLGRYAVKISSGTGHRVERCRFSDLGEGGVILNGGDRDRLSPASHEVIDCVFENFSRRARTYRPGVLVGGVGMRVARCEFKDAPHSAIIFSGNDHTFERNYFHDILTHTGDGGAVLGDRDWSERGTVIRENLFHRLHGEHIYENGVYLDDLISGIKVLDNVFLDCFWGLMIGGGRDNVVTGNLFVDVRLSMHLDARGLGWRADSFESLKNLLNRVPYKSLVWRRRYPGIEDILDDDPMSPKRNTVTDNVLVRAGRVTDDLAPQFKSGGTIERNVSSDSKAVFTVTNGVLTMDREAAELLAAIPGFNSPNGRKYGPTSNVPGPD